jgi:hypothetical protein
MSRRLYSIYDDPEVMRWHFPKKSSCGAESNRHSGAVGIEKRAEQSNPGGGHEVTGQDIEKPYEQKPAGMIPRPAGVALSPAHRNTEAEGSK